MNDIQELKKLARRLKTPKWATIPKGPDYQRLCRQESAHKSVLVYFFVFFVLFMWKELFSDHIFGKLAVVGILGYCGYLIFDLIRTRKLRFLFEASGLQNAEDVIRALESKSTEHSTPLNDRGGRE